MPEVTLGRFLVAAGCLATSMAVQASDMSAQDRWIATGQYTATDSASIVTASPGVYLVWTRTRIDSITVLERTAYDCRARRTRLLYMRTDVIGVALPLMNHAYTEDESPWRDILPDTMGESDLLSACAIAGKTSRRRHPL